ncbi:MAG: ATP-binding protein, partial [Planctomycetota bacterium]|jgi:tetratricopeptide (TPR) repeat protein
VEKLSQAGAFAGSVLYASPEQFTHGGEDLDGRSDLYALGMMLYELATGVHPAPGDDLAAAMHFHLSELPRSPSEVVPDLSPFLDAAISALIAKERDARFQEAGLVAEVLGQGEASSWWAARAIDAGAAARARPRHVTRQTRLYGRDELLGTLLHRFAERGVVLLEGEAGVGKTRLVDELIDSIDGDDGNVRFLFGGYPPGGGATSDGAFLDAFREVRPRLAELLPDSPLVPAFAALLEGSAPPAGVEPLSRDGLEAVMAKTAVALAQETPLVVCIDDLHFAPEEGRALFASLAAAVRDAPLLLIGTARPGLPEAWLAELDRLDQVTRHAVPRLGPKDLHGLLTDALRSPRLAAELGGQIAWKSDGNPFFVFEILQGLHADGLLRTDGGSFVTTRVIRELTVPSSVRELIRARISGLDEEDRNVLDLAACIGYEFDPAVVGEALGIARIPLLRQLAQLERKHRLVHASGRLYRFDHHQVQETLYDDVGELLREEYHAVLGDLLEQRGAGPVELATHFLRGNQAERARPHIVPALDELELGQRTSASIELADRVLAIDGLLECKERALVLDRKATRLNVLGHYEEAEAAFLEALACADHSERQETQTKLANLYVNQGNFDGAAEACRSARAWAKENGDDFVYGGATLILGNALLYPGQWDECIAAYEETIETAKRAQIDDPLLVGAPIGNLGWALGCVGRYREAIEHSARAIESFGDVAWGLGINWIYRIAYYRETGDFERAREAGEQALHRAHEMGYRWGIATALQELGALAEDEGDPDAAGPKYEEALAIRRELGEPVGTAETLASIGRLHGDREALLESFALAKEIGATTPLVVAASLLGEDVSCWLPRARRRQAIEALVAMGRTQDAAKVLAEFDVEDRALLNNVPLYVSLH